MRTHIPVQPQVGSLLICVVGLGWSIPYAGQYLPKGETILGIQFAQK